MKKLFRGLLFVVLGIFVVVGSGIGFIYFFMPNVGKSPDLKIEITPQRLERGKYLATAVAVCVDCHSTRDWTKFSGPMIAGTDGKGGDRFGKELGFPGNFYAKNITPAALGKWTDGEIFRAITSGVSSNGSALFPLMPYAHFGAVDQEDIYSIIAYVRSLTPIQNEVPASKADFPVNILMNLSPKKPAFTKKPDEADAIKYGEYLVKMASCVECHSKEKRGEVIPGTEFGGGREFMFPGGIVRTANITKHETGIGAWTKEMFLQRFKAYRDSGYAAPKLQLTDYNSPMPWTMYASMTDKDLLAIYAYLRTVTVQNNKVEKFTAKKS
jgi:mono/diheme cytochrome c family protein